MSENFIFRVLGLFKRLTGSGSGFEIFFNRIRGPGKKLDRIRNTIKNTLYKQINSFLQAYFMFLVICH